MHGEGIRTENKGEGKRKLKYHPDIHGGEVLSLPPHSFIERRARRGGGGGLYPASTHCFQTIRNSSSLCAHPYGHTLSTFEQFDRYALNSV
jgi:hypothetical protein